MHPSTTAKSTMAEEQSKEEYVWITQDLTEAQKQLWRSLPGKYKVVRYHHHETEIQGEKYHPDEIEVPTVGFCDFTPRKPTDPEYDAEIVQNQILRVGTRNHIPDHKTTRRVFRLKGSRWSVWKAEDAEKDIAVGKVTDLGIGNDLVKAPFEISGKGPQVQLVSLESMHQPWLDENRRLNYFWLDFIMGEKAHWQLCHRITPEGPASERPRLANGFVDDGSLIKDQYFRIRS